MKKKVLVFIVCVMVMVFGVVGCGNIDPEVLVKTGAEQIIAEKLKSPSTAKFSGWNDTKITKISDDTYLIKGYVDAQNSFGGQLRSNYSVEITIKDKENFSYKNLKIE